MMHSSRKTGAACLIITVQSNTIAPIIEILGAAAAENGLATSLYTKEWSLAYRCGTPYATQADAIAAVLACFAALQQAHADGCLKGRRLGLIVSDEPLPDGAPYVVDEQDNLLCVCKMQ